MPAIVHVKRNELSAAAALLENAIGKLTNDGASGVILACTETPVVFDGMSSSTSAICVDATRALAKACVEWWRAHA